MPRDSQPVMLPDPQRQGLKTDRDKKQKVVSETIRPRYATKLRMTVKPTCALFAHQPSWFHRCS